MSEGKRPGGLTALAVINFILAALGILGIIGWIIIAINFEANDIPDEGTQGLIQGLKDAGKGTGFLVMMITLQAVILVLLFLSGRGYLKQKAMGRKLGNAYALISVGFNLYYSLSLPAKAGGGFNLGVIIGLVYPLLTLILLNTTFKEDFTE